jgi:hypothetical protein
VRHQLHAARDHDVANAAADQVVSEMHGLLRRTAGARDCRARHAERKPAHQQRGARDVARLFADLRRAAGDHIVDAVARNTGSIAHGLQHLGEQGGSMQTLQRAALPADRRAQRVDDDRLAVGQVARLHSWPFPAH